jgi:hypothetical protein
VCVRSAVPWLFITVQHVQPLTDKLATDTSIDCCSNVAHPFTFCDNKISKVETEVPLITSLEVKVSVLVSTMFVSVCVFGEQKVRGTTDEVVTGVVPTIVVFFLT